MSTIKINGSKEIAEKMSVLLLNDKSIKYWKSPKFANDTRIYINNLVGLLNHFSIDYSNSASRVVEQLFDAKIYFHIEKNQFVVYDTDNRAKYVAMFLEKVIDKING